MGGGGSLHEVARAAAVPLAAFPPGFSGSSANVIATSNPRSNVLRLASPVRQEALPAILYGTTN